MEYLLLVVFLVFIAGIGMVALDVIKHVDKTTTPRRLSGYGVRYETSGKSRVVF